MREHIQEDRSPSGERRFKLFIAEGAYVKTPGTTKRASPFAEARAALLAHVNGLGLTVDGWELTGTSGGMWLAAFAHANGAAKPPPLPTSKRPR